MQMEEREKNRQMIEQEYVRLSAKQSVLSLDIATLALGAAVVGCSIM